MNAREMHYDFKQKLNKIDSQKYRNLYVPEIDWKLNEAQDVFVKMIAEPRYAKLIGFESSQRTIEDIITIVEDQNQTSGTCITPTIYDTNRYLATIPDDYWFHVRSKVIASKGSCTNVLLDTHQRQHDDLHERSPFDRSSFEWRYINMEYNSDGFVLFTDGTFQVNKFCLSYIRFPRFIHNAQDYQGGTYTSLSGQVLTGSQSCELPPKTHREIVDIAVLITTGDLQIPDYAIKANKLTLTN
jgi:hypothetical protein